jgi:hypothetical protein
MRSQKCRIMTYVCIKGVGYQGFPLWLIYIKREMAYVFVLVCPWPFIVCTLKRPSVALCMAVTTCVEVRVLSLASAVGT